VRNWKPGIFNIAGPGVITLWKFLRMAGRIPMPLIPPALGPMLHLAERMGLLYVPSRYDQTLKFGRGVSTDRMIEEFGFTPEYTTREAAERYADFIRLKRYHQHDNEPLFDRELVEYVQRKLQQMPTIDTTVFSRFASVAGRSAASTASLDDDEVATTSVDDEA
jgi:hypothetical protein